MKRQNSKRQARKLTLRKETVRTLASDELSKAAGGYQLQLNYDYNFNNFNYYDTIDCWTGGGGGTLTTSDW
jgi:hypothetical protein